MSRNPRNLASFPPANDRAPTLLPLLNPADWQDQDVPSREWAWADYIPHRQATYLTGPGSAGKSLLSQQLCTCIALGLPFMGKDTRQAVAIYATCEDDADELHRRQKAICDALGVPLSALSGKLHLVSLTGATSNALVTFTPDGNPIVSDAYRTLLHTARATGAGFLALDNVAHLFGGNENIRNQVAVFVGMLNNLASEIDGSVLFLGHPNKAGQDFSGSTAWENQVRSRLFMEVPKDEEGNVPDPDARVLVRGKANYARNGERIGFRWLKWAFVHDDDLPEDQREELAATIQANKDNDIFLRCLREMIRREQAVSENVASRTYAPLVFSKMPEAKGIGKARLEAAKLGSKHRLGRLLFSLSDIAAIALLHTLNASLKVAPSAAWEVHAALEAFIVRKLEKDDFAADMKVCVGFDTDGALLIWHIASDGVLETFNDAADERMFNTMAASRRAHITIPMTAIFDPIANANLIAQKWEADDA